MASLYNYSAYPHNDGSNIRNLMDGYETNNNGMVISQPVPISLNMSKIPVNLNTLSSLPLTPASSSKNYIHQPTATTTLITPTSIQPIRYSNFNAAANIQTIKSPLSPLHYQNPIPLPMSNNPNKNANNGRSSVIYPLTPQTMGVSPSSTSTATTPCNNVVNINNFNNNPSRFLATSSNNNSENYDDDDDDYDEDEDYSRGDNKNSGNSGNTNELYYEMSSKTYVSKSKEEGREGVRNGSLIKVDGTATNYTNPKKKKLSSSNGDESEDDDDDRNSNNINLNNHQGDDNANVVLSSRDSSSSTTSTKLESKSKTTRSRGGCLTCRQRKKRCCETKPICAECERLNIKCRWPVPGSERKNKSKNQPHMSHDEVYHEVYGIIKVLRGVVDYKIEP